MPVMRDVKGKSLFPLLICGTLLALLLTGKSFGISLGSGLPQAVKQTVNVNEKLQRGTGTLPLAAAKLKTASGGPDKKFEKCIGRLPIEMQISIRFSFNLSLNLHRSGLYYYRARYYDPAMGRFLQTDPMGYRDSMNLYQAMNQNPLNFVDPKGKVFVIINDKYRERNLNAIAEGSFSPIGARIFWKLLDSPIVIEVRNKDLSSKSYEETMTALMRNKPASEIDPLIRSFIQDFGMVDAQEMIRESGRDNKPIRVPIYISWRNIERLPKIKNKIEERNRGSSTQIYFDFSKATDVKGIITMYHELAHVEAIIDAPNSLSGAYEAEKLDIPSSSEGEAQKAGISVYENLEKDRKVKARIQLIIARELASMNSKNE